MNVFQRHEENRNRETLCNSFAQKNEVYNPLCAEEDGAPLHPAVILSKKAKHY